MGEREESKPEKQPHSNTPDGAAERDDVAAPDAPPSGEENQGMSTILGGEPLTGVQKDAGEE